MALTICSKCRRSWQALDVKEQCPWCKIKQIEHLIKSHCEDCHTEVECGECYLGMSSAGGKTPASANDILI